MKNCAVALPIAIVYFAIEGLRLAAAQNAPQLYTAQYEAQYKGRSVGTSEFRVSYDAATDTYTYSSSTQAKGVLRLASPNPVIDRSKFRFVAGSVQPLEFWHEDGSRKGEENQHIDFDWSHGAANLSSENGQKEVPLEIGTLDRGSFQVALMTDLANGIQAERYIVADGDSVSTYQMSHQGKSMTSTALGDMEVITVVQQREGSSRSTILELAPGLDFIPVKISQIRDGEVRSAFVIQSLETH